MAPQIATNTRVERDELLEFVRPRHRMILITRRRDGSPQASPVTGGKPFVEYFRNIAGKHSDWDEYRQAMRDQGESLIRITPDSWGPVATGGFPPESVRD